MVTGFEPCLIACAIWHDNGIKKCACHRLLFDFSVRGIERPCKAACRLMAVELHCASHVERIAIRLSSLLHASHVGEDSS